MDHTADLELEVWGADLPALFGSAARGLNQLLEIQWEDDRQPRITRKLKVEAGDEEGLLVSYLNELLYLLETERLAGKKFRISMGDQRLEAQVECGRVRKYTRDIKAVTYHRLNIREQNGLFTVNVVFDI